MRFLLPDYAIIYVMKVVTLDEKIFDNAYAMCVNVPDDATIYSILSGDDFLAKQIYLYHL